MTELAALIAEAAEFPPEPGGFRELGGALVWMRLPIPGRLHHINVWLLRSGDGWTLVDTGMAIPAVEDAWRQLDATLPALARLERIIVTHHHPDHFGMAGRLAGRHDVEVRISEQADEATRAGDGDPQAFARQVGEFADQLGLQFEPGFADFLGGQRYRAIISGAPARKSALREGDTLATAAGTFRVSLHHGHAPGHACLHATDSGILISGDQVLPSISPNISLYPGIADSDPLGSYLASLDRLGTLPDETLVLPAHGRPFPGFKPRLAALRDEHEQRLTRIVETCVAGCATAEIVNSLFRLNRLDALNRLLATTETLAHLRYLERRGRLACRGRGAALRWTAS